MPRPTPSTRTALVVGLAALAGAAWTAGPAAASTGSVTVAVPDQPNDVHVYGTATADQVHAIDIARASGTVGAKRVVVKLRAAVVEPADGSNQTWQAVLTPRRDGTGRRITVRWSPEDGCTASRVDGGTAQDISAKASCTLDSGRGLVRLVVRRGQLTPQARHVYVRAESSTSGLLFSAFDKVNLFRVRTA